MHRAVACAGQLGRDKRLLIGQNHRIKRVRMRRVCQQISHTGALKPQPQNGAKIVPVGGQLIAVGCKLQIGQRLFLPGVGRLNAEHPALGVRVAAPEADGGATGLVAGGLRQTLLPVREKAGIARDTAGLGHTAKLFHTVHQAALIIILRRHKAAAGRLRGIRRIHRYSPARR